MVVVPKGLLTLGPPTCIVKPPSWGGAPNVYAAFLAGTFFAAVLFAAAPFARARGARGSNSKLTLPSFLS